MTYEKQPENAPGIRFDEWLEAMKSQHTLRQIQNIRSGLFRREDKIKILEGLLYERVRDNSDVEDLMQALALLQENRVQDEQLQARFDNSLTAQVNGVIVFAIGVGIAATVMSYLSLPFCGNSRSKFCQGSRVIPEYVWDTFREPVQKPARVLPVHIKALD